MHALFRYDASQEQNVGILLQTPLVSNHVRRNGFYRRNAVGNETRLPPVCVFEILLHTTAQHDYLVRTFRGSAFTKLQIHGGEPAPLRTLPIQTVNRGDRTDAGPMRQTQRHTWSLRVVMNHIRTGLDRLQRGEERGREGGQSLGVDGRDGNDLHSLVHIRLVTGARLVVELLTGHIVAFAVINHDLLPACSHTCSQFVHNNLDATFARRNAFVADERDPHGLSPSSFSRSFCAGFGASCRCRRTRRRSSNSHPSGASPSRRNS